MTEAELEVVATGPLASLQDAGRLGQRRLGIPWAGVLAPAWQAIANRLVDNERGHAVIECFEGGFALAVNRGSARVAVAGDATLERRDASGTNQHLASWRSHTLHSGEQLRIKSSGRTRCVYIAIQALAVRQHHGSASTYARAGLGGLSGRNLALGDLLVAGHDISPRGPLGLPASEAAAALSDVLPAADGLAVHAVPGPQQRSFSDDALADFFNTQWLVSAETDRMGARLDGGSIEHLDDTKRDIVSDAIIPGAVQVPGNGRPILMLADAATLGGYPKIATVTSADLPRVALARPGTPVRFVNTTPDEAVKITRLAAQHLDKTILGIGLVSDEPVTSQLLSKNLIDGVVDAKRG